MQNLPKDIAQKAESGQVQCVAQDYFEENQAEGDIWYMRGVL